MTRWDLGSVAVVLTTVDHSDGIGALELDRVPPASYRQVDLVSGLKKLGFVESSEEIKFSIGKPRKLYSVTPEGMKFFEDMGVEIFEPPKPEQTVPNANET